MRGSRRDRDRRHLDELRESLQEGIALYLADPGQDPSAIELSPLSTQALEASAELVYG